MVPTNRTLDWSTLMAPRATQVTTQRSFRLLLNKDGNGSPDNLVTTLDHLLVVTPMGLPKDFGDFGWILTWSR